MGSDMRRGVDMAVKANAEGFVATIPICALAYPSSFLKGGSFNAARANAPDGANVYSGGQSKLRG